MQNVEQIKRIISAGGNILLQGKHGTGKTTVLTQAARELGLSVAYYSAPTMDPWADFVGVPVPVDRKDGTKTLQNIRPHRIDEAEIVIFDELNRADPKVLNAVLELVQFRTINGEALPKLRCVVAGQNPPGEDYNVDSLDAALVDRFEFMIDVEPDITVAYLAGAIGDRRIATHFVNWWKQRQALSDKATYISPRRLETMAKVYMKFDYSLDLLKLSLPPGEHDFGKLKDMLNQPTDAASINRWYREKGEDAAIRSKDVESLVDEFKQLEEDNRLKVVNAIRSQVGGENLISKYGILIAEFTENETDVMTTGWGPSKGFRVMKVLDKMSSEEKKGLEYFEQRVAKAKKDS